MDKQSFTTYLEKSEGNLWGCYVELPLEVAEYFTKTGVKRVVCEINEKTTFQCALIKNICSRVEIKPSDLKTNYTSKQSKLPCLEQV